jgi:flavorubredoxin
MKAPAPVRHHEPIPVGQDAWLIRQLHGEGTAPLAVYLNSLVIKAKEPVIVDTGTVAHRQQWLEDVFSLVEPADVRWIFLSHDDHDHVGNLEEVLEACPRATLVTTWFTGERLAGDIQLPLERCRWVNNGESFEAGDRTLVAVTPPLFDAPTTRGLFDSRTGVYWAADCFSAPVPQATDDVSELDADFWREGLAMGNRMISPWHEWLDESKWTAYVDMVAGLDITAIAGGHTPVISGPHVAQAFDMLREVSGMETLPLPGQADLEAMIAAASLAQVQAA